MHTGIINNTLKVYNVLSLKEFQLKELIIRLAIYIYSALDIFARAKDCLSSYFQPASKPNLMCTYYIPLKRCSNIHTLTLTRPKLASSEAAEAFPELTL